MGDVWFSEAVLSSSLEIGEVFTLLVYLDLCNNDLVSFDRYGNVHPVFKILLKFA